MLSDKILHLQTVKTMQRLPCLTQTPACSRARMRGFCRSSRFQCPSGQAQPTRQAPAATRSKPSLNSQESRVTLKQLHSKLHALDERQRLLDQEVKRLLAVMARQDEDPEYIAEEAEQQSWGAWRTLLSPQWRNPLYSPESSSAAGD